MFTFYGTGSKQIILGNKGGWGARHVQIFHAYLSVLTIKRDEFELLMFLYCATPFLI